MIAWRASRRPLNPRCANSDGDAIAAITCALRGEGVRSSLALGAIFAIVATAILFLRGDVIGIRPGQFLAHDITARASFDYVDDEKIDEAKREAALATPRIFKEARHPWDEIQQTLLALPDRVKGQELSQIRDADLASVLDVTSLAKLQEYADSQRASWNASVKAYVAALRKLDLVVIDDADRANEIRAGRDIQIAGVNGLRSPQATLAPGMADEIESRVAGAAATYFSVAISPKVARLTRNDLVARPTHVLDELASQQSQNAARAAVPPDAGIRHVERNQVIVATKDGAAAADGRAIKESDYAILRAEHDAFRDSLGNRARWLQYLGTFGSVVLVTLGIGVYVSKYAPRIIRNHARGAALISLLLASLLIVALTGIGTSHLYFSGVAPTILVALVLTIAYDQRFAIGIAVLHGVLATMALGQGLPFFMVIVAGSAVCCFATGDLRGRSRLIEIGGLTGFVLMLATAFAGMMDGDRIDFALVDSLWAAAAGLAVGFIVLGILPFVERAFRITTNMTLLELADTGQPLLRKLAQEAPGTYNHSMQVATLAEEAAEAIGGRALLARVGAYYHDIGKMNKPDYFIENQVPGVPSRHLMLNPNVSMLIIVAHVKDGVEMARQHNLPTALFPFILSHHGTTLVEYFYRQAVKQEAERSGDDAESIPEAQFRYPGPRPRSKEVAIVMIADAVESICRTIDEPNASRIESVVKETIARRLADGQFDECEITMRELHLVEKSLIRTLLGIYHARIAYPSTQQSNATVEPATTAILDVRTA